MKILIAPDKFKGSLTALEVCDIIKTTLSNNNSKLKIESIPLADGGEGTCELLTHLTKGKLVSLEVLDPLMRKVNSMYGISADGKVAFIEMALASGLQMLKPEERNCLVTSTYGTGQLIKHAVNNGVKEIVMGIGGSATNDAGIGMAQALGYRFISKTGEILDGVGENLIHIAEIDVSEANSKLKKIKFTVLSDVENPLYGKDGAAFVFGTQKGAYDNEIIILDNGLKNFAAVSHKMGCDVMFPGSGAAGGLGAGSKLFLNAQIKSGIDFIIEFTRLEEKIEAADMIITGEGKIDAQTLSGKVILGVAMLARKHNKKLVVVCGACALSDEQLHELGVSQKIELLDAETSITDAMHNAKQILRDKITRIKT